MNDYNWHRPVVNKLYNKERRRKWITRVVVYSAIAVSFILTIYQCVK